MSISGAMSWVSAALYDAVMAPMEALGLRGMRAELLASLSGKVLEIGIGTGLTLPHYPGAVALSGLEPDAAKVERAHRRVGPRPKALVLSVGEGEALPYEDGAFDAVVLSLVLCSVKDPGQVLVEVWRVLRRGGELRALEHVRAPNAALAASQRFLTPAWKLVAGGCHLDRDTVGEIQRVGFAPVHVVARAAGIFVQVVAAKPDAAG